jgi:hypothetical protein
MPRTSRRWNHGGTTIRPRLSSGVEEILQSTSRRPTFLLQCKKYVISIDPYNFIYNRSQLSSLFLALETIIAQLERMCLHAFCPQEQVLYPGLGICIKLRLHVKLLGLPSVYNLLMLGRIVVNVCLMLRLI